MGSRYDVVVVGAGILGLASARALARAGRKVLVVERGASAQGASVRNFGMVWPIGQPPGEMREIALRSREIWLEVLAASGLWHQPCGSLTLAYHEDELGVLEEFQVKGADHGYFTSVLTPEEVLSRCSSVRSESLKGGLWSPSEVCVDPRQVVAELPGFLAKQGVEFRFSSAATEIEPGRVRVAGEWVETEHTVVCGGDDFETLFPALFASSGLNRCKLQMLRIRRPVGSARLGVHLCAGLTLGHYANFRICGRLPAVQARFARELSEEVKWGIHLLVSEHEDGVLTVGDSHEYGLTVTPFLREEIDTLILAYLRTFLDLEGAEVVERWHGVYAKHPERAYVAERPIPQTTVLTGVGGAGMTLSFGLAEKVLGESGLL